MSQQANETHSAVVLLSGGMDSVTALWYIAKAGIQVQGLAVDYGQRHKKELEFARINCELFGAPFEVVDLTSVTRLLTGSALTDPTVAVPHGHYAEENMALTVVPNRNAMMLGVAYAVAVANHADYVVTAVHAGDHTVYPDCRPGFIFSLDAAFREGNRGFGNPNLTIWAPFVSMTKADIARVGKDLGVRYDLTWSCYEGGEIHCSKCATCVERREALEAAGVNDPTPYADNTYWRQVIANHQA